MGTNPNHSGTRSHLSVNFSSFRISSGWQLMGALDSRGRVLFCLPSGKQCVQLACCSPSNASASQTLARPRPA